MGESEKPIMLLKFKDGPVVFIYSSGIDNIWLEFDTSLEVE
jgi:hypothetical protein